MVCMQVLELCTGGTLADAIDPRTLQGNCAGISANARSDVDSGSLSKSTSGSGCIPYAQKISWASNCADAIAYLHSRQEAHAYTYAHTHTYIHTHACAHTMTHTYTTTHTQPHTSRAPIIP